jgi:hypothetical protein
MKYLLVLPLLLAPIAANSADECDRLLEQVDPSCKTKPDKDVASELGRYCEKFAPKLSDLEGKVTAKKSECASAGKRAAKKGAGRARGAQAQAERDNADLTAQSGALMSDCANALKELRGKLLDLAKEAEEKGKAASAGDKTCAERIGQSYKILRDRAKQSAGNAGQGEEQYTKAAKDADKLTGKGVAASDSMGNGGKKAEGSGGGSGGGGVPSLPSIPPQKKSQEKTPQQILAEQKAARQKECRGLIKTYNDGIAACNKAHFCQPEVVRVADVCDAYNACIGRVAALPSDCEGAPAPAQPK